mgnify:CR=1 FL=1
MDRSYILNICDCIGVVSMDYGVYIDMKNENALYSEKEIKSAKFILMLKQKFIYKHI